MLTRALVASALLAALPVGAQAATLYTNDFSANAAGFVGGTLVTSPSGESYLGNLTQNATAVLTVNTTGVTGDVTLTFNLYALLSLDGDQQAGGQDIDGDNFAVSVGGTVTPLFNFNFANFPGNTQNFPTPGSDPQTGASHIGSLGYTFGGIPAGFADSIYDISLTFAATGNTTVITFLGGSDQGLSDEFFGIDNVNVTGTIGTPGTGTVPEPATWGMMILGFGLVGAASRRRAGQAAVA